MTNFLSDFFKPQEVLRDPAEINNKIPTEIAVGVNVAIAAILGRNASFLDKAAYVAYPFVVEKVAKMGAQRGNGDPKK